MSAPPITERHLHHFHRRSPIKETVRVATTANITISTALNNGDTLDGITLATDDRVLVKNQTSGAENGIYTVGVSPARAYDVSTDDPAFGYLVLVLQGTANAGTLWQNTNTTAPTIGSTALTFSQFSGGGMSDPMTTRGDIIYRNSSNVTARLGIGGAGTFLSSNGTDVSWGAGAATITTKDEGSTLSTGVTTLDFVGAGVTASGAGATTTVTISGGGASLTQAYVGYNTIGGSTENVTNLRQIMKKVTLANDCLVTSIGVYFKQVTANSVIGWTCGLLSDSSGSPNLVAASQQGNASQESGFYATNTGAAGAARWVDFPLGAWVVAGDYWICVEASASGTHQVYFDSGSDRYFTNNQLRISDSGWTTVTTSSNKYSIRANTIR